MKTNEDFKEFFEKYHRFSIGVAFRIVKDRGIAEDISQEVFYNLYKMGSRMETEDERKLRSLVITATVNKTKDYLRKSHMKWEITGIDTRYMEEVENYTCDVEARMLRMEECKYQRMLLQRLRHENKMNYDILVKVKFLDIPPEVVAKEYGITRNNVNNRIYRTKIWLDKEMARINGD